VIADFDRHPLTIVVGSGGVGKTTLAAAMGLNAASEGHNTLVMTFDPSMRLKDTLGVGEEARDKEVRVATDTPGSLHASILDARATFNRLVERYAPDEPSRRRILNNRFYNHLAGSLAGVLEYMAVERLFEVWADGRYDRIILDTPPTSQALDFLEAPERIVGFLDSGALRIALKPWLWSAWACCGTWPNSSRLSGRCSRVFAGGRARCKSCCGRRRRCSCLCRGRARSGFRTRCSLRGD
jgi:anion-transporting  ArsA/GET3 family ATPase